MRHAVDPKPTVVMFCGNPPYDLMPIYALRYEIAGETPTSDEAASIKESLSRALAHEGQPANRYRSPLHDLFPELHVERRLQTDRASQLLLLQRGG